MKQRIIFKRDDYTEKKRNKLGLELVRAIYSTMTQKFIPEINIDDVLNCLMENKDYIYEYDDGIVLTEEEGIIAFIKGLSLRSILRRIFESDVLQIEFENNFVFVGNKKKHTDNINVRVRLKYRGKALTTTALSAYYLDSLGVNHNFKKDGK